MTQVTVELFKKSGVFYTEFKFTTTQETFESEKIKTEVQEHPEFIKDMSFTIEVHNGNSWNKQLFII